MEMQVDCGNGVYESRCSAISSDGKMDPQDEVDDCNKGWVVMKFGGTSLGTKDKLLAVSTVVEEELKKSRVVVVLSALSCHSKTTGTTTKLLEVTNRILQKSETYLEIANSILDDHLSLARLVFSGNEERLSKCEAEIKSIAKETSNYLNALFLLNEVSTRSRDYVIGYGERLSSIMFTHVLAESGIKVQYISLHDLISLGRGIPRFDQSICDLCSSKIWDLVKDIDRKCVPVLTGFIGNVPGGLIEYVGRGYTDFTASLTAVGIRARELQIWKDVDGVFTADPALVNNAKLIEYLTPEEAEELTVHGSEVIHSLAMELASKNSITVMVKNPAKPNNFGTCIRPGSYWHTALPKDEISKDEGNSIPTAVTLKKKVSLVHARPKIATTSGLLLTGIVSILEKCGLTTLMLSLSRYSVSIVFSGSDYLDSWDQVTSELKEIAEFHVLNNICMVTLVGKGLRRAIGSSAKMLSSLAKRKINIEMISQSASEISISVVVLECDAKKALKAIHDDLIASAN